MKPQNPHILMCGGATGARGAVASYPKRYCGESHGLCSAVNKNAEKQNACHSCKSVSYDQGLIKQIASTINPLKIDRGKDEIGFMFYDCFSVFVRRAEV